jgi:hypothetical protein
MVAIPLPAMGLPSGRAIWVGRMANTAGGGLSFQCLTGRTVAVSNEENPMQRSLVCGVLALAGCLPSWAQETKSESTATAQVKYATPTSGDQNYLGDEVTYSTTVHVKSIRLGTNQVEEVCVPAKVDLRGLGKAKLTENNKEFDRVLFSVGEVTDEAIKLCPDKAKVAKEGTVVAFDPDLLVSVPPRRTGWSYGTLVVPYKFQFKGDRSLSGGATLGGYLGYRVTRLGTTVQPIFFAGATKVDVPKLVDGKSTTEQLAGLSYGIGLLSNFKQAFQVGLVVGADRVSKGANYVNNGKPWVSLSLGYAFLQ